jgi:ABC-2 type transport system permease protein
VAPRVELLDPKAVGFTESYFAGFGFAFMFFMMVMMFGNTVAQNTVVEKQTRIVEILLAAVPTRVLLAGKVLGVCVVAIGETVVICLAAWVGLLYSGMSKLLSLLTAPLWWYVVFFAVGFVLFASLFAACASLVSRMEDVAYAIQPVTFLLLLPYILVISLGTVPLAMAILSYIPFTSTVAMPVRLFQGEAAWWEPLISLALLVAATVGVIALAAKVYERSILRMGSRLTLRQVLRGR